MVTRDTVHRGNFTARVARVKQALDFGDVAGRMVQGSSPAGWDCPRCSGERTVKERPDAKGGRCKACGKGYDTLGFTMEKRGETALQALVTLERIADDKGGDVVDAADLFGGAS